MKRSLSARTHSARIFCPPFFVSAIFLYPMNLIAGASGPTVGNPNVNEASEEAEPRQAPQATSMRRVSSPRAEGVERLYGLFELRHHASDYFSEKGERLKREPSLHGGLKLGARVYGDKVDINAAFGAVKIPATQAIYQERPELSVEVSVLRGSNLNLLWYNRLQFPVAEAQRDPTEFGDNDLYNQDAKRGIDASVFTVGLAPSLKTEWRMFGGKYAAHIGADGWTRVYSKPLYIDESNESGASGAALVEEGELPVEKRFEDRAMRYVHQEGVSLAYVPSFMPWSSVGVGAYSESRYIPQYFRDDVGGWDYSYRPERISFWHFRLSFDLSQTWSLQDEVYVYREGFFAKNRVDENQRFKNIVKIAAKL